MCEVIQINPEIAAERAASLLLLEKLRFERDRIQGEIDRITHMLDEEIRLSERDLLNRADSAPDVG